MNRRILIVLLLLVSATLKLVAQGTAFNYQGRLNDGGAPATGAYDFRFAVYDAVTNGNAVSVSVTNAAVGVTNGLFSVTLDFGAGVFGGTNVWLNLAVRAVTVTNFTPLFPRQPVLPVPYAIFATGASNLLGKLAVAQISGNLPASQVAGTSTNLVNFTNSNNTFGGTFGGTFTGNGASLSSLNASQLTTGTVADARLTPNVALLDHIQTFTGTNTFTGPNLFTSSNSFTGTNQFTGANTFTNLANSFSGSFFGNGLVGWVVVNGAATNAAAYHAYLLLNAAPATVTLPTSTNSPTGSIVRVAGGAGGWSVKVNSGQSIVGTFSSYGSAALVKLAGLTGSVTDGAASADGVQMFAVGADLTGVYGSSDSGRTWSAAGSLAGFFNSVACSANGRIVYAQPTGGSGYIRKSTDGGATWNTTANAASANFIACTSDGTFITPGNIACSGNGTYRAKLASGVITISTNAGGNWTISVIAPAAGVTCLAASSDCTRLLAGVNNGKLYATANMGTNWTVLTTTSQYWSGVWLSSDGNKLAATVSTSGSISGGFYSAVITPLPTTTTNSITGSQGSAVELQYLGNGQFMPVSSTGTIWAN